MEFQELCEVGLQRQDIYDGTVLHVVRDKVMLPNGKESYREFCLHVGAVSVIPILSDGRVIMERQFRYAHGRVFLEIPAGKLNYADEPKLEAAIRELYEETGARAGRITCIGELDTSPALLNEVITMYMAEDITLSAERDLDEDEFLNVELIPLSTLLDMVMAGEIKDAKTQISILKAARLRPQYLT